MRNLAQNEKLVLAFLCLFSGIFLLYAISNLSISYYEAEILYNEISLTALIARISCGIFGQNDLALRIPFLLFYFANSILIYAVGKFMLKRRFDRVLATMLFMALPGTLVSAIVVNFAGIAMTISLALIYLYESKRMKFFYILLILSAFADKSVIFLHFSILIFSIYTKERNLGLISLVLVVFEIFLYDYGISGKPKGYFLDTFGIFASVFSPFVFLFFIYMIYRIWIKEEKNLMWFISVCSLIFAFCLSFRQRLQLDMFLPYCVISVPLIVKVFLNSYRVRLPQFRKKHKFFTILAVVFLALSSILIIFNQFLYSNYFKSEPDNHFVYKYDVVEDLARELKSRGISAVQADRKTEIRLKFYGISDNGQFYLSEDCQNASQKIEIYKAKTRIATYCIY